MANVLSVNNLVRRYGHKTVVKGLSFSMESGQVTGLLGPNGAGKTTTFYMIVGFIKANGGSIILDGTDITSMPMYKRSRLGLSYLPQESSIFRKLTVEENIRLVIQTRKDLDKQAREKLLEELISDFGIDRVRRQPGYTLSGGERRRTEIARALATSPHFLLLDEPFAGIDPKAVWEIKQLIKKLSAKGIGILLTDHNVRDALSITTCAHIINEGSIIVSGTRQELISNELAQEIYFGHEFSRED